MVYSKIIDKQIIITDPLSCSCHVIPNKEKFIKTSENKKTIFLKKPVYKILGIRQS